MAIENKSQVIPLRVTPSQARLIREVAAQEGERTSVWLRQVAVREARQVQRGAGGEEPPKAA